MVSAAEFIGILLFIVFIIWAVCSYTLKNFSLLAEFQLPSKLQWLVIVNVCLVILFAPFVAFGRLCSVDLSRNQFLSPLCFLFP